MFKNVRKNIYALIVGSLLLAACGGQPPAVVPTPQSIEVTRIVAGTPEVMVITATSAPTQEQLPAGSVQLTGQGATFPLPLYDVWTTSYQFVDPSVNITYIGTGSGAGKKAIIDGTVDFAGSDSVLKPEEYTSGKDLQMYPIVAGAIVPIFNVDSTEKDANNAVVKVKALVLDRQTLADIFQAKITKWNDPAIVKLNPDAKLAETNITVIHRSDSSGTTEAFTKALNSFSETWKKDNGGPGAGSTIEWPVDAAGNGIGAKGNPGVAVAVSSTPNSIGYVELSYAKANNLVFAQLINKADKNVTANAETLAAAMAEGKFDNNLNASIFDGSGENAWPISTYTYLILHTTSMTDCVKAQKLLEYIQWTLTDPAAAKIASDKGYAVLPAAVLETVKAKLAEVTCNGQPVVSK